MNKCVNCIFAYLFIYFNTDAVIQENGLKRLLLLYSLNIHKIVCYVDAELSAHMAHNLIEL